MVGDATDQPGEQSSRPRAAVPHAQTPSSHANQPCKARQPPATTTIWIAISRIRRFCLHACDQAQQRPQFPALHRLKLEIEPRLSQKMRQASLGDASLAAATTGVSADQRGGG
jgi:hypothetical protein